MTPAVVFYRDHLFQPSETFIPAQGESLTRYEAFYAGTRRVGGLPIPRSAGVVIRDGSPRGLMDEVRFKGGLWWGHSRPPRRFLSAIEAQRPVLVHAQFGADALAAVQVSDALDVPLVVTFHGAEASVTDDVARHSYFSLRVSVRHRRQIIDRADHVIAVSQHVASILVTRGFRPDRIDVLPCGVDTDMFRPVLPARRRRLVLFVGRMVEIKRPDLFVAAVAALQRADPAIEAVAIGDGPLRGRCEQAASAAGASIRFLGVQPPSTVRDWMEVASVLVCPSVELPSGEAEGAPMVVAEAGAMGVPVVASLAGGTPEVVADGDTGLLVPPDDVPAIVAAVRALLDDDVRWRGMSERARAWTERNRDLAGVSQRLEQIYDSVLQRRRSA